MLCGEQWNQELYPYNVNFRTRTFADIFPSVSAFVSEYADAQIPLEAFGVADSANVSTLYYLLYAKYGNSRVASSDETRFKYRLWSIVFSYGPSWVKRVELQGQIRALTPDQLEAGGGAIYNKALNPDTEPGTGSVGELPFVTEQNVTKYKKNALEALAAQWEMLATDVTEEFLDRFAVLFLKIVAPEAPLMYC